MSKNMESNDDGLDDVELMRLYVDEFCGITEVEYNTAYELVKAAESERKTLDSIANDQSE
jgi:hypothetical protein